MAHTVYERNHRSGRFRGACRSSEHPGKDRFALKDMAETPIREKVYEDSPEQPPEDAVFSKVP